MEAAKGRRDDGDRYDRRRSPRRERRGPGEHRLTVLGLPPRTTWQDLKDLFKKVGDVQYADVQRDGEG